ncbi:hypothetical protein C8N46_104315 [Kordia periserrulae]|uniref:Lipoprotein n=1 Tax=Kordia periserrulae TaxID=701523 RepID=A0A2T6C019_9FLAO|nr:hypothetical protein [Kordia periserrulae]PTX61671.1 hypothetical protein C8N46_104315 [Kordia periserrulae]
MKKLLKTTFVLCLSFLMLSCSSEDDKYDVTESQSLFIVKSINDLSPKKSVLEKEFKTIKLFEGITEMKNFKVTEDTILNKTFIQGEGINENGYAVLFRTEIKIEQIGSNKYSLKRINAKFGESCSGVNCSKCVFAEGGGCDCETTGSILHGPGYCNHSTSVSDGDVR